LDNTRNSFVRTTRADGVGGLFYTFLQIPHMTKDSQKALNALYKIKILETEIIKTAEIAAINLQHHGNIWNFEQKIKQLISEMNLITDKLLDKYGDYNT